MSPLEQMDVSMVGRRLRSLISSRTGAVARTVFALLLGLVFSSNCIGVELLSVDLVPTDEWRYFFDESDDEPEVLDVELQATGFYDQWIMSGFEESNVLMASWRDVSLPLTLTNPSHGPNTNTVFFRKTFELTEPTTGSLGLGVLAFDAFTVYLDGDEVFSRNCCVKSDGTPVTGPPGLLSHAIEPKYDLRTAYKNLGDFALAAGEHTLAVSVQSAADQPDLELRDIRLFQQGNEATWTGNGATDRWTDAGNWLFGIPNETDFIVFPINDSTLVSVDESLDIGALRVVHNDGRFISIAWRVDHLGERLDC